MIIEPLSVDNLREGVFCSAGKPHGEEMHSQLKAWLDGGRLRGQIARDNSGEIAGFVLYYPMEFAPLDVDGNGFYMVQCVFVKPKYQNKGIGTALIHAAIQDAQDRGAAGLAAEGANPAPSRSISSAPAAFFRHVGMSPAQSRDSTTLFYTKSDGSASEPHYLQPHAQTRTGGSAIRVDLFDCRRCHLAMSNRDVVEAVMNETAPSEVELVVHDQTTREAIVDKGMSSGIFVNGKLTYFQGPVTEEDIWNAIEVARSARKMTSDR